VGKVIKNILLFFYKPQKTTTKWYFFNTKEAAFCFAKWGFPQNSFYNLAIKPKITYNQYSTKPVINFLQFNQFGYYDVQDLIVGNLCVVAVK